MRLALPLLLLLSTAAVPAATHYPPDLKWTERDGVSVPVPPAEHPRLFLRTRDIPDLKRRVEHPVLKPVWGDLQQLAGESLQNRVEVDALRYLLTHDAALGKRTVETAIEVLKNAHFPRTMQDVTRPVGRMMVTGAIVYDWCYPLLTADQKKAFQEQLIRLAGDLECKYPPVDFGWVTGHGSEWMIMRDMLSAGIALYDEYPDMYNYAARIIFKSIIPARNWWYPGHAFHQGSSYAETRFVSDMYPLWIFDRMGAGNVFNPSQQFVPYQWIYMRRPDGQLLRAGDGQSKPPKLRSLLCASYYGDGYVLADYLKDPGPYKMDKLFVLLWRDPDLKPLPISDLPLSRYMGFPYGWMIARTGWGEDSVIAEMKVNVYNFGNHQHHDAGAFQIYYKGPLAIDSGLYEGSTGAYGSPHHQNYYKRTIAHNSLLIYDPDEKFTNNRLQELKNDGGQRLPNTWREPRTLEVLLSKDYKTGDVLAHDFGPDPAKPEYTYLKGDLTQAYSAKVKDVRRSFVFLNLGDAKVPAALVIFDKITSSKPDFKKIWLLHSMEEPRIAGDSVVVSLSQRGWTGKLVNRTLLPEAGNLEINKVGGPGKEFWVFGENFPNEVRANRKPEEYEVGEWRAEVSPKRPSAVDCFLNVMQVTADAPERALPVQKIDAGAMVGMKIADRIVLFGADGARTAAPVRFSVTGGTSKVLLADLAAGTWQIWRDGNIIRPAAIVNEDSGTLYFEAQPGNYELRR